MNLQNAGARRAEVLELLEQLVRIGAPTFKEKRRSDFILNWLREHVTPKAGQDEAGNLWADLSGGASQVHLLDAHIDTVFPHAQVELRKAAGSWHAPGVFDNTVTCAFLLVWAKAAAAAGKKLPFVVVLSTAEEGEGNLAGARAMAGRFKSRAAGAVAFDLSLARASRCAVGSVRSLLTFDTTGGHSWNDFGAPNAIHEAARWLLALEGAFPWRRGERSFNAGTLEGGTGINVIASQARLKLDVRSTDPAFLAAFGQWLEKEAAKKAEGEVRLTVTPIGLRPAGSLPETHPLVRLIEENQRELGLPLEWAAYSTNANAYLAAGIPTVVTGLARGSGIHTEKESLELSSIEDGWRKLVGITTRLAG